MVEKEFVWLDSMDGFEFEQFCARVFEKLGYVRVKNIKYTGDEGRDIVVHSSHGQKMVVECKHHPEGTIGRPIVQKLHSAAITSRANKAMLITTGKFSKSALEYAKRATGVSMELVDLNLLRDMADRAGIKLLSGTQQGSLLTFHVSDFEAIRNMIMDQVFSRFISAPNIVKDIFELTPYNLYLKPTYVIRYSIHVNFVNTVGVRVHSIHINNARIILDGETGDFINEKVASFMVSNSSMEDVDKIPTLECPISRASFKLDTTTLKKILKQHISKKHTAKASYYGRNNRLYTYTCKPSNKDIYIADIRQVFLPKWVIHLRSLSRKYIIEMIEKSPNFLILSTNLFACKICGGHIRDQVLICNSCGNVAHPPKFFGSHSFICKRCGKTICKECTYWIRRWLFFKQKICEECAERAQLKQNKPKRKLIPSR